MKLKNKNPILLKNMVIKKIKSIFKSRRMTSVLILSFGFFGLTALIFQVVFAKQLVLLFGLTAPAIATVLAVYFSGLAIGSILDRKSVV